MSIKKLNSILGNDVEYVKCIKKNRIDKNFYTYDEMVSWKNSIGMLIPKGYVVVDIDDMDQALMVEKWLDEENVERIQHSTRKGKHFIFKSGTHSFKNGANLNTYIHPSFYDLKIDIRAPKKGNKQAGYIILPDNDSGRKYDKIVDKPDVIPDWLFPSPIKKHSDNFDLSGDSGSRNTELFKYTLYLRDNTSLSPAKIKNIIAFINSKFNKPLDQNELSTILRDENCIKPKTNGEKDIALQILDEHQIKKSNGILYIFDGHYYAPLTNDDVRHMILSDYNDNLKMSKRNEVYNYIYDFCEDEAENNNVNKFTLLTPTQEIDLRSMEININTGDKFITSGINFDYDPELKSEFVDKYMESLFGDNVQLMYEAIGYSFLRTLTYRKSFWLLGPGGTGKSFFVDEIMRQIYTTISEISIADLSGNDFAGSYLSKSLVNLVDDASINSIKDAEKFKSAISGNTINSDVKNKDRVSFKTIATWFITNNEMPHFYEKNDAVFERIVIIPVTNKIKKDPFFLDKFGENEIAYIVKNSIEAAQRVINNGFSESKVSDSEMEKFKHDSDTVLQFINEISITNKNCKEAWTEYKLWCDDSNFKSGNKTIFEKRVTALGYSKDSDKDRRKIWVKR